MNICRWGAAVGALGPFLYICGGSDDASRLETVERFDPFANVWVPSVPMSSSRNGVGVTAGGGRIYAIGILCTTFSVYIVPFTFYSYQFILSFRFDAPLNYTSNQPSFKTMIEFDAR